MELSSSRGLRKLLQLDECIPASFHPTFEYSFNRPVFPIKGLNDPDYPQQLPSCSLKPDFSHPIPPKLCSIKAYRYSANPTSNHLASWLYVSQWRSVARWETNGADLLPSVRCKKNDQDSGRNAYELCRKLGCLYEDAVQSMNLSFLREKEPDCPSTVRASRKKQDYGQIAPPKPCPKINVESLPPSNVALISPNISHSYDISANPSCSPLSSSFSTPSSPLLFPRFRSLSESFGEHRVVSFMASNLSFS